MPNMYAITFGKRSDSGTSIMKHPAGLGPVGAYNSTWMFPKIMAPPNHPF